jgi:hypothetical protein
MFCVDQYCRIIIKNKMDYFKLALKNISSFGDTDIFPFPIENKLFFDYADDAKKIIENIGKEEYPKGLYPIHSLKLCVPVGYTGYRWATFIDPWWNAYFLGLVLSFADKIESKRIPIDNNAIFSYRIKLNEDTGELFDKSCNWRLFYETAVEKSKDYKFVVQFDIADFYNRIYHHRLENTLKTRIEIAPDLVTKTMNTLMTLSNNASYGLPIGGNAARILAEALLSTIDNILGIKNIKFCRFVDDFVLFANSKEEAYKYLNFCADFLLKNEGLALQKNKTVIMTAAEFANHANGILDGDEIKNETSRSTFYKMHIHYDPYSQTATEDYEDLKKQILNFDIVSFINSEVKKSKIHQSFAKQIVSAVKFLEGEQLNLAVNVITDNIESLYTIYPSVMRMIYKKIDDCETGTKIHLTSKLTELVRNDSYLIQTENNAAYTVRVLSKLIDVKTAQAIDLFYNRTGASVLLKANCIMAMVNMGETGWLSDLKSNFIAMSIFEQRAFLCASYYLGDEGTHWRKSISSQLNSSEKLLTLWIASKQPLNSEWKLPL